MVFRVSKPGNINSELFKSFLISDAIGRVIGYKISTNEILLNRYCLDKYDIGLKPICKKLILNAKVMVGENDIVISWADDKLDKLASLITYGNGKLQGQGNRKRNLHGRRIDASAPKASAQLWFLRIP